MAASKPLHRTRHYATLQPRTLNVAQSAIRKKWTKLPENSQLRVGQLLRSIELSVQKDSRAGLEVQSITSDIANMLMRKLPRMPFPPKTEEDFFDYEATLNRIVGIVYQNYGTQADMGQRALEAQLTADEHSTSILKAEIEKEQRLLDEDKKELEHLERAFRDEEARRQRHNKGLHPLAKRLEHHHDRDRTIHANPWLGSENPMSSCGAIENDVSLAALLEQLYSHLGSMHNNTRSIKQIPLAMDTSQAALDSFTWRFLDKDKYAQLHGLDVT